MALKTFNLDKKIYDKYSKYCKDQGISMSRRIEKFIKDELEKLSIKESNNLNNQIDQKNHKENEISSNNIPGSLFNISEKEHSFKKYC